MSELKVNSIKGTGASTAAITIDSSAGTCTANITNNLSNRNIIINGAAQVNQRGDLTGQTSSVYFVDRFRVAMGSVGTWSLSQSTDTPDGFGNSMKLDCTTAKSSLDADSFMMIQQKIEGQNAQAFAKGTSAAKQFAVSFYIKSNVSGTYTAEVQDNDNNRIASKTFTVSDGNWNRYSLVFPADTTGAFDNDNAQSMDIKIWLVGGTNYSSGTVNTSSWASKTNVNRVSSSNVNLASSTSNELYITGVQLEVGSVVTDFEHRSFAQELASCQRYYFKLTADDNDSVFLGYSTNGSSFYGEVPFPTSMRTMPTFTGSSTAARYFSSNTSNDFTISNLAIHGAHTSANPHHTSMYVAISSADGGTAGVCQVQNDVGTFEFSAEL